MNTTNGSSRIRHRGQRKFEIPPTPCKASFWRSGPAPVGVDAPRARTGRGEIQPDETVENSRRAVVDGRPEALGGVELELSDRQFPGQDEGDRPRAQPNQDQETPERFQNASDTHLAR